MKNFKMVLTELVLLSMLFSWSEQVPLQSSHDLQKRSICSNPHVFGFCSSHKGTPAFYSHCIENMFRCQQRSFALSYSKERFLVILNELKAVLSKDSIGKTLESYLYETEVCFESGLAEAAKSLGEQFIHPNPHSCLTLETMGIETLNRCYQQPSLCQVLEAAKNETQLEDHLVSIVESLRFGGDYYNSTMVDNGLPLAVEMCGHPQLASRLASKPLPVKINFCANGKILTEGRDATPLELIEQLSSHLDRSADEFIYSGLDNPQTALCSTYDFEHIVSLIVPHDDAILKDSDLELIQLSFFNGAFEFSTNLSQVVRRSQCGDGIRQAGELCDYKDNLEACSTSCQVREGYQCSTDPLVPSSCTEATPEPVECLNLPSRARGRSRAGAQSDNQQLSGNPSLTGSAEGTRTLSAVGLTLLALLSLLL